MNNLKYCLTPMYIVSKFFCLNPFTFNFKTGVASWSYLGTLHCFIAATSYSCFHLYSVSTEIVRVVDTNLVTLVIDTYSEYCGCFVIASLAYLSILQQSKVIKAIQLINEVDSRLNYDFNYKLPNYRWTSTYILQVAIVGVSCGFMEYYNCIMFIKDTPTFSDSCLLMCYIPIFTEAIFETQYISYMLLLRDRYKAINFILNDNHSNYFHFSNGAFPVINGYRANDVNVINDDKYLKIKNLSVYKNIDGFKTNNAERLSKLLEINKILHKITKLISSSFAPQYILILTIKFIAVSTLTYDGVMSLFRLDNDVNKNNYNKRMLLEGMTASFMWAFIFFNEILMTCLINHITANEANQTLYLLSKHSVNYHDKKEVLIVKMFTLHLLHSPFKIIPCGLFNADLTLAYSIISAVASYLIILVQFDMSQKGPPPKEFTTNWLNNTERNRTLLF